jgi:hypothetical protein
MNMKVRLKFLTCLIISFALIISSGITVFSCEDDNDDDDNNTPASFSDVDTSYWAYDAIMYMANSGIISGYGNGTFKPDGAVKRSEFAKMMVNALGISLINPYSSSFMDVSKSHWSYKYVESAKYYLTGFRTSAGDNFKPELQAVREDMAVALVKALGYNPENADLSLLNSFGDSNQISTNLKAFVALAVQYEIIQGYSSGDDMLFGPKNTLTRAEAATLLYRIISGEEEKVTYDEDKVTYNNDYVTEEDEDCSGAPLLQSQIVDGKLVLNWSEVSGSGFKYYKVVVSKYDSTPAYPENGYLYVISDINNTNAVIKYDIKYSNGDFGQYISPGENYYFAITAVFDNCKLTSNILYEESPS